VIQKPRQWGGPGPLGAVAPKEKNNLLHLLSVVNFRLGPCHCAGG